MNMDQKPRALCLADALGLKNPSEQCLAEAALELRRLHAEVEDLKLAEEGAKEAFGAVVQDKRDLEKKCKDYAMRQASMNADMRRLILERDELARAAQPAKGNTPTDFEIVPKRQTIEQLASHLELARFRFCTEVDLQDGIELLLKSIGAGFARERSLSASDRPDFLVEGGIAIEIKIKGTFAQALRQIDRYTKHPQVQSILVIGSPVWIGSIPVHIGGKPVRSIRITGSLL